jgi:hypothetical protein
MKMGMKRNIKTVKGILNHIIRRKNIIADRTKSNVLARTVDKTSTSLGKYIFLRRRALSTRTLVELLRELTKKIQGRSPA